MDTQLRMQVESWLQGDPDPVDRAELQRALDASDEDFLKQRFSGRLSFGTAGLRGPIGAGPCAMNTAVIRQTCHGLADVLIDLGADLERGVVIGYDARHRSDQFAHESAAALRARGVAVYLWDQPSPTPATSFWVRRLGALAGIQVTASHNPPQDNGFKVYWDHAAQIIPPVDTQIAEAIDQHAQQKASDLPVCSADTPGVKLERLGASQLAEYWKSVSENTPRQSSSDTPLRIVYTAMHGVGGESVVTVLEDAGFEVCPVPEQQGPDARFPTVAFPNPEEDGAMDLAVALAKEVGADLVLANDPDADRLAVALPSTQGFELLNGNEIGLLLGDHCLHAYQGPPAVFAASIVSSQALRAWVETKGHVYASALTGFKWIMAERRRRPEHNFIFGYEEALGYCVGETVADKDGVSAALAFAHSVRLLKEQGKDPRQRLNEIYQQIGFFVSDQWVQRFSGTDAAMEMERAVDQARMSAPQEVCGLALVDRYDFNEGAPWEPSLSANLIALNYGNDGDGLRVLIRPSGTEPKVKTYFEYRSAQSVEYAQEALKMSIESWRQALEKS